MARPSLWLPFAAFACTPLQALDLTPQHTHRDLEGFRIPVVRFRDRDQTITYQPPAGWRVTGTATSLQLIPGDRDSAAVQLRVESRSAPAPSALATDGTEAGDEADSEPELPTRAASASPTSAGGPDDLEKWARGFLPAAATQVERIGATSNAFMIGTATSRELTFSYSLPAGRFVAGVAAVDLSEKERLAVITVARREDFKKVHDDAIASLFSWQAGD